MAHLQWRRVRRWLVVALVSLTGVAQPAAAQFPAAISEGVRIRVRVAPPDRRSFELWAIHWYRGRVTGLSGDTLFLDSSDRPGVYVIPRATIERLYLSAGRRSRGQSALRAGVAGAAASFLFFSALPELSARDERRHGQLMVFRTVGGAVVGMAAGALVPLERWRRVPLAKPARDSTAN